MPPPGDPAASALTGHWAPTTLLGSLPPESQRRLVTAGGPVRFAPGAVLLRQGDEADHVLVLLQGWFKVSAATDHGETLLAIRVGGDIVGEMGCLDGQPRLATVRAVSPASARRIRAAEFADVLAADQRVALAVSRTVARKLRWADRRRVDATGYPPDVRLARVLYELAAGHGRPVEGGVQIGVDLTQHEVATLAGTGDATTHRILTGLRQRGVIDTGYRKIRVTDPARLREAACLADDVALSVGITLPVDVTGPVDVARPDDVARPGVVDLRVTGAGRPGD